MTVPIIVVVTGMVVGVLVQAWLLRLVVRLLGAARGNPPSFRGALAAIIPIAVLNILSWVIWMSLPVAVRYRLSVLLSWGVTFLVIEIILIVSVLRLRLLRGLGAWALWFVLTAGFTIGFVMVSLQFVEFFVVPTGAMAETLHGWHKEIRCPDCGYRFAVNASREADPPQGEPPERMNRCSCPNCRRLTRLVHTKYDKREPRPGVQKERETEFMETADPGVTDGVRIAAVRGWLAGSDFPQRVDVIVFRYPKLEDQVVKYVKRVIGLPGETVAIHGGDIYILSPDDGPKYDDSAVPEKDRWQPEFMHEKSGQAAREQLASDKFRILRKSPEQVLTLMRPVFDNDHLPQKREEKSARWQGEDGWTSEDNGHSFRHAAGKAGEHWMRYRHLLPGREGRPVLITSFEGYNSAVSTCKTITPQFLE